MSSSELITAAEVEEMRQRLAKTLNEYAQRAAESGDLNGFAAFELSAQFVLAEPVRRCYPSGNESTHRPSGQTVSDSEPEVDCLGIPV